MEKLIFDTHAHYTADAFDNDRHELLASLPDKGVALAVNCGTDFARGKECIEISDKYSWIYTAIGIHPESLIDEQASTVYQFGGNWKNELKAMEELFENEKVLAVGECGLDHHWPVPKDEQLLLFEAQIRLAAERELPLIIHDREAHGETYALLKKYKPRAVLHAYSGSSEDVKWLCKQGVYIGFTGVVTFKNAQKPVEAAKAVPPEYLLAETDCPYMAPVPFRGKRSDSSMIWKTGERLGEIRGMETEELLKSTMENGKRFFNIG